MTAASDTRTDGADWNEISPATGASQDWCCQARCAVACLILLDKGALGVVSDVFHRLLPPAAKHQTHLRAAPLKTAPSLLRVGGAVGLRWKVLGKIRKVS